MERYERLQTCADVRALSRGIGESLPLDYKGKLSGRRRDLAADVCALANTQGGVLVVGVKDPEPEGSPPKDPLTAEARPVVGRLLLADISVPAVVYARMGLGRPRLFEEWSLVELELPKRSTA